jgi:hypothetical protein
MFTMLRFSRPHALVALALLVVEVCIAAFVHDGFVRPYLGDLLVVGLIYFTVRACANVPPVTAAFATLAFACVVEGAQAVHLIQRLGLQDNAVARVVMGDTFEWLDLVAYAAGVGLSWLLDRWMGAA